MVGIAWERDRVVRVVETAAVLALCALAIGGNLAGVEGLWRRVLAVALGAAMTVPLLARRRAPLAVATAVVGATWLAVRAARALSRRARFVDRLPGGHLLSRRPCRYLAGGGRPGGVNGPGGSARDRSVAGRRQMPQRLCSLSWC